MIRPFLLTASRHRLAWLLWLALLLPLAQAAGLRHGYSHLASTEAGDDKPGLHGHLCGQCLDAAAVTGAAPPAAASLPGLPALRHESPARPQAAAWPSRRGWAYRSRAPPSFQH